MVLTSRFFVELDKCPECEGIWLNCDEIEKIAANNNIRNELYKRNQSEKTIFVIYKIRVIIFIRMNIVKMHPLMRCLILNSQNYI
jgi:hypothetical protein